MASRSQLYAAVKAGIITKPQADALQEFLRTPAAGSDAAPPRFTFTHVLYYLGGMIAIGALSLFLTLAWDRIGAGALLATTVAYAVVALVMAGWFERRDLPIPAGIMATLVLVLVPLAVYAIQHLAGFWPASERPGGYSGFHRYIDWRWIVMELATLAAGAVMLWRYRYAFLVMPVAVTLWYMGMDLVPLIAGGGDPRGEGSHHLHEWVSLCMGLVVLGLAMIVDLRSRATRDYAFWLYLFGLASFWGGMSLLGSNLLSGKLVYLAINLGLVLVGAVLMRRTFAVFGGVGIAFVLGDISRSYFKDSFAFTIALTFIGLAIVGAGVWWQRHEAQLAAALQSWLPREIRELLEARHDSGQVR